MELLRLCHQPIVDFDELAKVIEQEPALSAKILQAVNNVFYRQWSEVTNIRRLLVVLGLDRVRQIAVTTAVHQFFSGFRANNETFVTSVWVRSLFCAYIAQDLARLTGYPVADEAYVAGLLHRIGQLVLLQNFPNEYQDVL
ncbi:MAG: HDOD domain-containing protein, partial [Desulfuromonadaceae bacterium]